MTNSELEFRGVISAAWMMEEGHERARMRGIPMVMLTWEDFGSLLTSHPKSRRGRDIALGERNMVVRLDLT